MSGPPAAAVSGVGAVSRVLDGGDQGGHVDAALDTRPFDRAVSPDLDGGEIDCVGLRVTAASW